MEFRNYVLEDRAALNLAGEISSSFVNGPGDRYVVWSSYCPIGCLNCFNPELWSDRVVKLEYPDDLGLRILMSGCEGVTLSGGEPMSQPVALLQLLKFLHDGKRCRFPLGIICFTGYELEEVFRDPLCSKIASLVDVLVSGPYVDSLRSDVGIGGSTNKRFWYNTRKGRGKSLVSPDVIEFDRSVELHDDLDGIIVTGFPNFDRQELRKLGLRIL